MSSTAAAITLSEDTDPLSKAIFEDISLVQIAFQTIKVVGDALLSGPIMRGTASPADLVTSSVTSRGIVNIIAIATAESVMKPPI